MGGYGNIKTMLLAADLQSIQSAHAQEEQMTSIVSAQSGGPAAGQERAAGGLFIAVDQKGPFRRAGPVC